MVFEEVEKHEELRGTSFKNCPNKCVDGFYIDPYKHKRIKCDYCAEKREEFVRKSMQDKSGKTIEEMLNLPPSFSGINFDSSTVFPKGSVKDLKEDTVSNVKNKLTDLIQKISIGDVPTESLLFNLGRKAYENNFICPYLLRAFNSGKSVVPMFDLTDLCRLRNDYEQGYIDKDFSYKDLLTRDVCIVVIDTGATRHSINAVKGLMQLRANKGLSTIIFTNSWGTQILELCSDEGESALNLATLYSIEYIEKVKDVEEKEQVKVQNTTSKKSIVGISSEEFRNLMSG